MELSPGLYRTFVRPKWFTNFIYKNALGKKYDFNHKMILDFGCGIGSSSFLFPSAGYIGIDCDECRVEYAKKHNPDYRFITVKDNKIPLPDNSMDFVMIFSVLHHIPSDTLKQYLSEFHRVLKKDGSIIIVEPCLMKNTKLNNWFMKHLDRGKFIRSEKGYLNLFRNLDYKTQIVKKYKQLFLYNKILITALPMK